jgi:hypothetical protein
MSKVESHCPVCGGTCSRDEDQITCWSGDYKVRGLENHERLVALTEENARLRQWVSDLQSGMFVNCVYCGHRYGKTGEVPESMADVLKAHIEVCPQHPMSRLKVESERLKTLLKKCEQALSCVTIQGLGGTPDLFPPEGFDDWEEWDEWATGLIGEIQAGSGCEAEGKPA